MKRNVVLVLALAFGLQAAQLDPRLQKKWDQYPPDQVLGVIIHMQGKADLSTIPRSDRKARLHYLQNFAQVTQRDLLAFLHQRQDQIEELRSFWIFNGLYLKATKSLIQDLLQRTDIAYIEKMDTVWLTDARRPAQSIRVQKAKKGAKPLYQAPKAKAVPKASKGTAHSLQQHDRGPELQSFNWNIDKVKADSVWLQWGLSGQGVILGNLDTGVDVTHPALASKFLGYWFDGVNGNPTPYDDHGHGTHTMGTMVGGDGPGTQFPDQNDVGIAYGAQFVAAKGFSSGGWGEDPWILACYEFFASLIDSGVNIRIVSNSWGSSATTDLTFWDATMNWRDLGIIPVFANGNSGPSPGSAGTPGNFPIVIGVGATDSNDNIANFSSRGPAPNQAPWNDPQYWPRPDWNLIKPNISAPGVEVRSTVPGGGYESAGWSGTSMATPHVAATIALMLERNPSLDFEMVYDILLNSVDEPPQGGSYPNNDYGWGRLNALKAVENTPPLDEPYVKVMAFHFDDSAGNSNGQPDPGETVDLYLTLKNLGLDVTNVQVTLSTTDTTIQLLTNQASFGDLAMGDTMTGGPFTFTSSPDRRPGMPAGFSVLITGVDTAGTPYTKNDTLIFSIGTPQYYTWAMDDFEAGMGSWSTGGTSMWGLTNSTYHSPSNSATDSPNGTYGNNADTWLLWTLPLDLSDAYFARLIYWTKYDIESGWDYGYVEITDDTTDPNSWQSLKSYTGTQSTFVAETLSLNNFVGSGPYFVRFRLETDGSVTKDGWYIDDIAFEKDVPLTGVHLYLSGTSFSDSLGGDNNGIIDPGETIQIFATLRNQGMDLAQNVQGTLVGDPDYITITDPNASFGDIPGNGGTVTNDADPFEITVDPQTPLGYDFSLELVVTSATTVDTFLLNFRVARGGDFLIWDPDPTPISGMVMKNIMENLGLYGDYTTSLADYFDDLLNYSAIFVTVGMYPNNYRIMDGSAEAQALVNYLQNGGNLYLEGGDVWYWDPGAGGYDFGPRFGIAALADGGSDLYLVQGMPGTFTEDMNFVYNGENSWVDQLAPSGSGAFAILQNPSANYDCAIANVGNTGGTEYRTVGASFEFGGLQDGTYTKEDLLIGILDFFGVYTDVEEGSSANQLTTFLANPTPNPVRGQTVIQFGLDRDAQVSLEVYDASGRRIETLLHGALSRGLHTLTYQPRLPQGVYFLRMAVDNVPVKIRKLLVLD